MFPEAITKYTQYLNLESKKPEENITITNKFIVECNSAVELTKDTIRIELFNPGTNINSEADDYSPVLRSDGQQLYYVSRKQYFPNPTEYEDAKFDENIYISELKDSIWQIGTSIGKDVNTKYSEAPLYVNPSGDQLFIYAGYEGGGDIMKSVLKKGKWKAPEPADFTVNSPESETSLTVSPSGNEIFFVSDRKKGSQGATDIFVITKTTKKTVVKANKSGSGDQYLIR